MWGRAVLAILVAVVLLPAETAAAGAQSGRAVTSQQAAARAARMARRHAKLDVQLNDAVEDALNDESNVIIEFNDETDAVNLVRGHGGKSGRYERLREAALRWAFVLELAR